MTPPVALEHPETAAISAPLGFLHAGDFAAVDGRSMVILHELGGEKERANFGPRELRDLTCAALERSGWSGEWGLGGVCREMDEAANFALAGYTGFTFDLAPRVEESADTASLDDLDARIVALEDAGVYPAGWHEAYLGGDASFHEETLARAAVKFGAALTHAEDLQQAMRTAWSGRGGMPDIEISIRRLLRRTTGDEVRFIARELLRRGIWAGVFAPSFGPEYQPGLRPAEAPDTANFASILQTHGALRLAAPGAAHTDRTDDAFFAMLTHMTGRDPALFRAILAAARDAFPVVRAGWHLLVTEDDVHMMPEVEDASLAATDLEHPHGRQLLRCTWDSVCESLGDRIRAAIQ